MLVSLAKTIELFTEASIVHALGDAQMHHGQSRGETKYT